MDSDLQKKISNEDDNIVDYLPNAPLKSNLINYEQFAEFWKMVPSYVRIRIPQFVFRATEDGYNL